MYVTLMARTRDSTDHGLNDMVRPWASAQTWVCAGVITSISGRCVALGFSRYGYDIIEPLKVHTAGHVSGECSVLTGMTKDTIEKDDKNS